MTLADIPPDARGPLIDKWLYRQPLATKDEIKAWADEKTMPDWVMKKKPK